jgi:hypothetical protein
MARRTRRSKLRSDPDESPFIENAFGIPWPPITQIGVLRKTPTGSTLRLGVWVDSRGRDVKRVWETGFDGDPERWELEDTPEPAREANLRALAEQRTGRK